MKTVLLADHHPPTLEHLREALIQAGYTVRAASDPGRAMEYVIAEPLDAVLVSIDFPRLSGQHLCQLVRAHDQAGRMPVIAMDHGHLGQQRGVAAILDFKASAYVADPMKFADLKAKLSSLLAIAAHSRAPTSGGVQGVLSRPPIASGELKFLPLPSMLQSFYRLQRDGVLVVAFRDLTRRLFLLNGAVVSYDSSARQDSFPSYLVERGAITEEQATQVARSMAGGMRISTALADAGVALGDDLLGRLRDYIVDRTAQVVGMRDGRYAFYEGAEFTSEVAKVDIPAMAPVLEGARRSFPLKVFVQSFRMRGADFPVRAPAFGKDLPALGLDTNDLKIAMQLNGRIPLRELLAHGRGELREACSLLWFLLLCGAAQLSHRPVAGSEQEAAYAASERIAPRKRKPLPPDTLAELRDAAVKILTGSYFQVLGLDITADTEAVEKAYQEVGIRFHPDTYAEWDTSEIHDVLDSVQDKLSGAYRVLSVDEKRKSYVQFLATRAGAARLAPIQVDAEVALKRGELAMKRKDLITARRAFEEATSLNGREPEYYSYLAWATFLTGAGDRKERARAAQKIVKKALAINPNLERAQVISAVMDAEQGDGSAAHKKLIKVLEANPGSRLAKAALRKAHR